MINLMQIHLLNNAWMFTEKQSFRRSRNSLLIFKRLRLN